ncbi:DUF5682 family protein [Kitasatospora sp. RB6PN24]|uniref:DUF5682 family protein n=1 Tax=Kitasatospora humi TaxID=2893891 RepID=UPI001E32B5F7|nr:DUF5682 family protein [Kitasatospora humi]MCC9311864.1 DUF5682 family protein [Kitasatospora humi]
MPPAEGWGRLAASGAGTPGPYLIGVRHHAPSLATVLPALLDAHRPEVLLVELPEEFQPWLGLLADEHTKAPVALTAAAAEEGPGPAFYPFADFSPELAALRWAARHGVPAVACDLPLARRTAQGRGSEARARGLADALRRRLTGRQDEDLWDRLVEALAPGCAPEEVRRAALLVGWALREDAGTIDPLDLYREEWMRDRVRAACADGRRVAVVVGAFHAPALLDSPAAPTAPVAPGAGGPGADDPDRRPSPPAEPVRQVISLIPYTYPLLDARSGYPAGIRDPEWQHTVLAAGGDPDRLAAELTRTAVRICDALRGQGHPAGPADAREIVRVAGDLARLRGLPAPGRGELVEAVQTVLAQGEPLGRGRAVARALERVLVGTRTGSPTPAAPRTGLSPAVEALLAELGLPGPADAAEPSARELRLDPLRSPLDARRELLLRRLEACGVPYGERIAVTGAGGTDALGSRWRVRWTPAVAAMLTVAGMRGVTPSQAAEGTLRERLRREHAEGGSTARQIIDGLAAAAGCALPALTGTRLVQLADEAPAVASLAELLDGLALLDRLTAGHIAGHEAVAPLTGPAADARELLTTAAIRGLEGITGSDDPADARALVEFARRADTQGGIRLGRTLQHLADDGSPLIRGAAGAARVLLGHQQPADFGDRIASWVDGATTPAGRAALSRALTGLLTAAEGLLTAAPEALEPLLTRIAELSDDGFLDRLPALRGGFDTLSPAARDRLLDTVEEGLGEQVDALPAMLDPATLAAWTKADLAAGQLLTARGLLPRAPQAMMVPPAPTTPFARPTRPAHTPASALPPTDRWRLLLGRQGSGAGLTGQAARIATALDELYGTGRGEGSGPSLTGGGRGGREAPYPGVREWSEELAALFGPGIREEVLAAAAAQGRRDVLEALAPEAVRPSVELLRTVLQHAGGLPEARLAALRPLVKRLVDELSRELASTLRPALTGLSLPRPSYRRGGRLDLDRTIRANLGTARPGEGGTTLIVPERPVFRTRATRANDWRLVLVVDVSGSMEASTIWAALTASILAGVPSLTTHFVAFSTSVLDLSGRVDDPLGLLLEVRVGGGTHIAAGLRYARELVTVPSRTLIAVVSDFEEGYPLGGLLGETRTLIGEGCHLLGCAALDDTGKPRYSRAVAEQLVAAGMPVAALSPQELARWVGEKIR